jgi:hypothetical protein
MGANCGTRGLLTGRPGRLIVVAAAALVPALAVAGAGVRARAAVRGGGAVAAGVISTVAGGVGGPAKAIHVGLPSACGVAFAAGSLYIGDGTAVRRVSPGSDELTTLAGTGSAAPLGNGGLAVRAALSGACVVAADHAGNLVIADEFNNRVRVVAASSGTFYGRAMTAGHIYTVAGDGTGGFSGDGGPATSAKLNGPDGVAVDGAGNLVIADQFNNRVRVVAVKTGAFYGRAMTAGDIYTVAGNGTLGFSGDGGPAAQAEMNLSNWHNGSATGATGVAVDGAGNLVIADTGNNRVRVVAVKTGTFYGRAMTAGNIYTVAGNGTASCTGDGGPATSAELDTPAGVVVDGAGNLVIAEAGFCGGIQVVAASSGTFYGQAMTAGDIYGVAGGGPRGFSGDGGPATQAGVNFPEGVAVDGAGNLVIADSGNHRIRVVAASSGTFYGQAMTAGDIYTVAGNSHVHSSGDGGRATSAEMNNPAGVAVDGAGNLVIADQFNSLIRVVAAAPGTFYGQAMTAGDIYTVAGDGKFNHGSGDGGPATKAALNIPSGVAVDGAGNLVIADTNDYAVRVVAVKTGTFYGQAMTAGDIYHIAGDGMDGSSGDGGPATQAGLSFPSGVAVDGAGNLVIADLGNNRIRVVAVRTGSFYGRAMTAGDIYTVAGNGTQGFSGDGGPATAAELNSPTGVAVDGAGNLVIADTGNNRLRVVAVRTGTFYGQAMTAGDIYTAAGDGTGGFAGDGGPATSAELNGPHGAAVDAAGNLVLADTGNNRARVVAVKTGTFYGQAMTAGDIYTAAGNGKHGFSGDGGPATSADLSSPNGVAADASGNLVLADTGNNRIRTVAG